MISAGSAHPYVCQTNWFGQSLGLGTWNSPDSLSCTSTGSEQISNSASLHCQKGQAEQRLYFGVYRCLLVFYHQDGNSDLSGVWSCLPLVAALHQGLGGSAQGLRLSASPNQNLSHRICKQLTLLHCVLGAALYPCTGIISPCARPQAWKTWDVAQINHPSLKYKQSF